MMSKDQNSEPSPLAGNPVEKAFVDYLLSKSQVQPYSKSKQKFWLQYMLDERRPEKILEDFWAQLKKPFLEKQRALDIGCGFGGLLIALQLHFKEVCRIDINEEYVEWAAKRNPNAHVTYANAKNFLSLMNGLIWCVLQICLNI